MDLVWNEIKRHLVKGERVGSFSYQRKLNLGADIFMSIRGSFKDEEAELRAFNSDMELGKALVNRRELDQLAKECFGA